MSHICTRVNFQVSCRGREGTVNLTILLLLGTLSRQFDSSVAILVKKHTRYIYIASFGRGLYNISINSMWCSAVAISRCMLKRSSAFET